MSVFFSNRITATATLTATATSPSALKRLPLAIERLLARSGVKSSTGKFKVADLDAAFAKAGMSVTERMRAKAQLVEAGLLD